MLKTTDAALLIGSIQSCSLTLWNSLSPSCALPQEGKMRATDVAKKTWCCSNLSLIVKSCVPFGSCPWQHRKGCAYLPLSIPTQVSPDSTEHWGPCSSSSSHTQPQPGQSPQSYFLLTPFEPIVNLQSSWFIPLYHPSGSCVLALSGTRFIVTVISFLPSRKSITCCTDINTDWPVCR